MNRTNTIQPSFVRSYSQDSPDSRRVILRDGTVASIRTAVLDDVQELREFILRLSPESRRQRFLSTAIPDPRALEAICCVATPDEKVTLIVTRYIDGRDRIIAEASYMSCGNETAEVSMAVADDFQGMGLGTILLERLSAIAIQNGFRRFQATTEMDNHRMIEVFRGSGFPVRERVDAGSVEVDFDLTPTESSVQLSDMRERLTTTASIRPFFRPNSVAVVGASRDPASIGYRILDEILRAGFKGAVHAVNPHANEVRGIRTVGNVRDISGPVDLAVIAVPREVVLDTIDDCASRGVRALVVITAGFSEAGEAGKTLQDKLLQKVRGYGMRMIGPNCMGLFNAHPSVRLNASFSPLFPASGTLAMSSQSGALGLAVLALASERHLGFSTFVSVGNKADVSGNDLLQFWETDSNTGVILLYLESFGNPRRFARIARRVGRSKPIVAVKAGRTRSGGRAAGSHTAALAANDVAVDALFRQTGVIRADTIDGLFDIAAVLGNQPLPKGRRVAIVTNAGGPGILCADACESAGLSIAEFSSELQGELRTFLPAASTVTNPVDMVASAGPDNYRQTIKTVLSSMGIDALIIIYIPVDRGDPQRISEAIQTGIEEGRSAGGSGKPVLACLMSSEMRKQPLRTQEETVPVYSFPEAPAMALSKCATYSEWRSVPLGAVPHFDDTDSRAALSIVRESLRLRGDCWLDPDEVRTLLNAYGIPQPAGSIARNSGEAVRIAERLGYPVAMKVVSSRIIHKSDAGGIHLNVSTEEEVRSAFDFISAAAQKTSSDSIDGVLIQSMVRGGIELMAGVTGDPLFGPLVAFGLGGVNVEILHDVQFRVAPLTDSDAREMVQSIRGFPLLNGFRGKAPADIGSLEEILLRLSQMAEEIPEIAEMDLNPIIALPPGQGCVAVDARIRVKDGVSRVS